MTTRQLEELDRLTDKLCDEPIEVKTIKDSLTIEVNSALLTCGNHCSDNSFICNNLDYFISSFRATNYLPYGVCKNPPYNEYDSPMVAYVFYDEVDEVRWVHMPQKCLLHLLSELYGTPKAKQLLGIN